MTFVCPFGNDKLFKFVQEQLIDEAGYQSEAYSVETSDGYILKIHRIKVQKTSSVPRRGPVFFMHGLFATASDYLMTGKDVALRKSIKFFQNTVDLQNLVQRIFYPIMAMTFGLETREETITVTSTSD